MQIKDTDIIQIIRQLSEKYSLNYITYDSLSCFGDSYTGNGNFDMLMINSISILIEAFRNSSPLSVTAVFTANSEVEDSYRLCLLLHPDRESFDIIYDFKEGMKDKELFNQFENACRESMHDTFSA